MKILVGFIILLSLVFLFGGLLAVGSANGNGKDKEITATKTAFEQPLGERLSMKKIDSLTAHSNLAFTAENAGGSSVYAVNKY